MSKPSLKQALADLELAKIYAEDGACYTAATCARKAAAMLVKLHNDRLERMSQAVKVAK